MEKVPGKFKRSKSLGTALLLSMWYMNVYDVLICFMSFAYEKIKIKKKPVDVGKRDPNE
jgi:hypothetical protein